MANWKDILLDTIKLSDDVKRLNAQNEKLADLVVDINLRLTKIEAKLAAYSEMQVQVLQTQKALK